MSKEQKQELKENGFIIFEFWQFVVLLITIVIGIGVFVGTTQAALNQHEKKIENIEKWESDHETRQRTTIDYSIRKVDEISFNMQSICKKLGIEYISTQKEKE